MRESCLALQLDFRATCSLIRKQHLRRHRPTQPGLILQHVVLDRRCLAHLRPQRIG